MNREEIIRLRQKANDWAERELQCTGEFHPDYHIVSDERFAVLVLANTPPQSSMSWQEGYAAGCATADKDMKAMRQLATGKCTISKVVEELGPLSLWSKDGLEQEIGKALKAERNELVQKCIDIVAFHGGSVEIEAHIRSLGEV